MNNIKTMVLMAGLLGLFLLAGQLLGGSQGLVLALVLGSAFNFIMYFFSDKIVLRMYGAQIVSEEQAPELYRMVDRLRQREFEADRVGAEILGRPIPLANALRRLDAMAQRIPMQVAPAAAPLAQVNPLAAHGGVAGLFSTHPPTEERVARLEAMTVAASR